MISWALDGRQLTVERVVDTGRVEPVYNIQVAEDHTYYVGSPEWGFGVLVHNSSFFSDYWHYLWHPSEMDPDLRTVSKVAFGTAAVAGVGAVGLGVAAAAGVSAVGVVPLSAVPATVAAEAGVGATAVASNPAVRQAVGGVSEATEDMVEGDPEVVQRTYDAALRSRRSLRSSRWRVTRCPRAGEAPSASPEIGPGDSTGKT